MGVRDQYGLAGQGSVADMYSTPLTADQESAYQAWKARLPHDLQNEADYDLRGAFLASVKADGRLHMTDKFKKPNHMTFSDGSQYSTPQTPGGTWVDSGKPNASNPRENAWVYWPTPYVAGQHNLAELGGYFQQQERGNTVVYPTSYRMPRRR